LEVEKRIWTDGGVEVAFVKGSKRKKEEKEKGGRRSWRGEWGETEKRARGQAVLPSGGRGRGPDPSQAPRGYPKDKSIAAPEGIYRSHNELWFGGGKEPKGERRGSTAGGKRLVEV